jgi:Zn-dependent protease
MALADNVASVLGLVLAEALAAVSLVVWHTRQPAAGQSGTGVESSPSRPGDHWTRSARGAGSATGFFFTGRRQVLTRLAHVTRRGEPALALLLGMPGAGKSAVLSVLVLRAPNHAR